MRDTGELHLYSRTRGQLWHKGATSGTTQAVHALRLDRDCEALLALVEDWEGTLAPDDDQERRVRPLLRGKGAVLARRLARPFHC